MSLADSLRSLASEWKDAVKVGGAAVDENAPDDVGGVAAGSAADGGGALVRADFVRPAELFERERWVTLKRVWSKRSFAKAKQQRPAWCDAAGAAAGDSSSPRYDFHCPDVPPPAGCRWAEGEVWQVERSAAAGVRCDKDGWSYARGLAEGVADGAAAMVDGVAAVSVLHAVRWRRWRRWYWAFDEMARALAERHAAAVIQRQARALLRRRRSLRRLQAMARRRRQGGSGGLSEKRGAARTIQRAMRARLSRAAVGRAVADAALLRREAEAHPEDGNLVARRWRVALLRQLMHEQAEYVRLLRLLRCNYLVPLSEATATSRRDVSDDAVPRKWLTSAEHGAIMMYASLPRFEAFHRQLLAKLHLELQQPAAIRVGHIFLELVPMLRAYQSYSGNLSLATRTLADCSSQSPALERFLTAQARALGPGTDLQSLLVMPVYEAPRQDRAISALLRHTPSTHVDFDPLSQVLKQVERVARHSGIADTVRLDEAQKLTVKVDAVLGESFRAATGMCLLCCAATGSTDGARAAGHGHNAAELKQLCCKRGVLLHAPVGATERASTADFMLFGGMLVCAERSADGAAAYTYHLPLRGSKLLRRGGGSFGIVGAFGGHDMFCADADERKAWAAEIERSLAAAAL